MVGWKCHQPCRWSKKMSSWSFSQILTHRHRKATHFISQKWYCFWQLFFRSERTDSIFFSVHNSIYAKLKFAFGIKNWPKSSLRSADNYLSLRFLAPNFSPIQINILNILSLPHWVIKRNQSLKTFLYRK